MSQRTATIESLPEVFGMVKAMQADGGLGHRLPAGGAAGPGRDHPGQDGGGRRPMARRPRRPRRGRPPQRNLSAPPALRARRHRVGGAADPPLLPHRRAGELCAPGPRDRPCRPRRLRARPVRPQGRRGPAAAARATGPARDRQPRRPDIGLRRRRLPPPPPHRPLQGPHARRRGARAQDGRRRRQAARP